jgi:ferredoxin
VCVQVCPTGIDIRDGLQYECIGCAACIDACDEVMDKMGYPRGLIRYSTERALEQGWGKREIWRRVLRPRVLIYSAALATLIVALPPAWAAHALQGRHRARPRHAGAHRRGRPDREHLPRAGHERHRAATHLQPGGRRPARPQAGERAERHHRRRAVDVGAGAAAPAL